MPRRTALLVGIDVGTSSCKTTVVSEAGRVVAEASRSYRTRRRPDGEVSQDPADWLRAVRATLTEAVRSVDAGAVEAISVTAAAHYAVLLDAERRPMGRVLLSSDGRPGPTAERLKKRLGARFFGITNEALTAGWTLPQLRWLIDQDPRIASRLSRVLIAKDWVRAELTGEDGTDPSDAAGTGLYDQAAARWSDVLVRAARIRKRHLPPILAADSTGGGLTPTWARRVGLRPGIPFAVGATDTAVELVSVGATEPGDAIVKIASTGTVVVASDSPRPDARLMTYPHAVAGRWYEAAATSTAVTSDTWLRSAVLAGSAGGELRRGDARRLAARVRPGSDGLLFLPYLEGERTPVWDGDLRGAFLGLSSSHGRGHLCRAVLEGVAMSLRHCRDTLADVGIDIGEPVLTGGGLRSPLWQQIVVDALGVPARVLPSQGPSIGAAMMAGMAVGIRVRSRDRASLRRAGRRLEPHGDRVRRYDELFATYKEAAAATREVSHRLSRSAMVG